MQEHQSDVTALLARLEAAQDAATEASEPPVQSAAVLVVDDHEGARDVAALTLRRAGFEVSTAANGVEALLKAHELRPLVIVMDLNMPILNGVEATRLLRAAATTRHARVIAYTADPSFAACDFDDLFAAILHKPSPPAVVVETVREVAAR
jgi:CheY-like chemotaxis protein